MHLAGDSYCHCRSRLSAMFTGSTGEDLRFRWGIWGGCFARALAKPLPVSRRRPAVSAQGGQALVAAERAGQADQDGRPSGAALPAIDLSVVRGVGSSTVVPGSVGSYRPVIAGAKLRENATTILPRGRARSRESACLQCAFTPLAGSRRRQRRTRRVVYDYKRIPYRIDRPLTGLAGPDYGATISFGLPVEPEDSQYGKSRLNGMGHTYSVYCRIRCKGGKRYKLVGGFHGFSIEHQLQISIAERYPSAGHWHGVPKMEPLARYLRCP